MSVLAAWKLPGTAIVAAIILTVPALGGTVEYLNGGTGVGINIYWPPIEGLSTNWGDTNTWGPVPSTPLTLNCCDASALGDLTMSAVGNTVHITTYDQTQIESGYPFIDVTSGYYFNFRLDNETGPTTLYYQVAYSIYGVGAPTQDQVRQEQGGVVWMVAVPPAVGGVDMRYLTQPDWWTTGANVSGTFGDTASTANDGGLAFRFQTTANGTLAHISGDFQITLSDQPIGTVPEPAGALLLGPVSVALGWLARGRRGSA